ncbi:MAG TPA: methionyl-tRNA formyltransferase [Dehalococcoidia bacterium]|nr:methionyl-tRNA formyltransferase [Dehalococcoidia bacterium]
MNPHEIRTIFMGSPAFAVPALRALVEAGYPIVAVYAQPDRPAGRGRALVAPEVKRVAAEYGLTVLQPERLRTAEAREQLQQLRPDLIVVAAYGQILRPAVIALPRFGCLNVHASLLPRHRGASAVAAAILAGDAESGVSIMQIDPGMDTGPVLGRRSTPVLDGDTTGTLADRLSRIGAELLIETLPGWIAGHLRAVPQDESHATLAPPIAKEDGTLDWTKPALRLWREVRAYYPWPVSSTRLRGEPLQILEAWPLGDTAPGATPGTVLTLPVDAALSDEQRGQAAFAVATGAGLLAPLRVRRAGRGAASAAEFARGARELLGSVLG